MAKSILQGNRKGVCYLCGRWTETENHHIFGGGKRKKADRDGLTVYLCHYCHNEPPNGVHFSKETREHLKRIGETAWCTHYGKTIEDFIKEYGKNYI